ncbi:MAG: hydroxylamine reductase [candidate division KSB1 bacterium]|nr:hydroxylamine reductase [candidate division KSB1 bacterium]
MFCYQCEQTKSGTGCDKIGVCGKSPEVADLQDILVYQLKGIGYLAHQARQYGRTDEKVNRFTVEALFTTVTNVDFDPERMLHWIQQAAEVRNQAAQLLRQAAKESRVEPNESLWPESATYNPANDESGLLQDAVTINGIGVLQEKDADIRSLQELLTYGLKGMAAYADHAAILGQQDDQVYAFFHEALSAMNDEKPMQDWLELNMRCGMTNVRTMELLDTGHTATLGHPEPTVVSTTIKPGPAIVVSGHDMLSMLKLLQQTEGKGINIYTHGEMLPAHGYPELKKFSHLSGHFGTAWQNQQKEFDGVPAAYLFNTNCIQKPKPSYRDQVFTSQLVAWPGVTHIENYDFSPVIDKALQLGGLTEEQPGGTLMTGFGHNAVMNVADNVVDAVKNGDIRHFFLVGGCDGAKPGRNYYTEFVEKTPEDTVVLTLACGKFRFNDKDLGEIGGLPRLMDVGQCNDAYSAIRIAQTLSEAFDTEINELPLSLVLSWYEQKAVVILLSLLALGIKGVRLGPTLPAFLTDNVLNVLVDQFDVKPVTTADEDLKAILG